MSTPNGDNAFLHHPEANVEAELTLAEADRPGDETTQTPVEQWQTDPADAMREEVMLRSLLDAVEALETGLATSPAQQSPARIVLPGPRITGN